MKIFVSDHSWAGSAFVIADNRDEAHELLLSKSENYKYHGKKEDLEELEICHGQFSENMGDS